jgi:hypothetical protein
MNDNSCVSAWFDVRSNVGFALSDAFRMLLVRVGAETAYAAGAERRVHPC